LNYTLGAKFYPVPNVMFRASVATGEQYPTIGQLTALRRLVTPGESIIQGTPDPKRGNQQIGGGAAVLFLFGGNPELRSERAVTVTAGAVINPAAVSGPRVSVDYSRIDRRGEIVRFPLSPAVLLAREGDFEGRVARSPLSAADAQLGYTAGEVITVDIRSANDGRTIAEAVDVELDWRMPFIGGSEIQLYGGATWQPQLRMRSGKDRPWLERIGYFDGPSAWRGNIGAEWTRGPISLDLNLQAFSSYRITYANPDDVDGVQLDNGVVLSYEGRDRVGSQAYLDLSARRRFQLRGRVGPLDTVEVRFGIQNVLDKRPATIASPFTVPYSTYGDARRRRFELTLSSRF
jgi:outer membrane receptor protein involved in Fe transport